MQHPDTAQDEALCVALGVPRQWFVVDELVAVSLAAIGNRGAIRQVLAGERSR